MGSVPGDKRAKRQRPLTFIELLKEELKAKKRVGVLERDIARQASIDASTLSLIKKNVRIKNPTWELRLRLATALREDVPGAVKLAERFFSAEQPAHPSDGWREHVKNWKAAGLQSEIKSIRFGLPLFFDTAPFLVAEKNGYFEQLGLDVSFDYVKWNKSLTYFDHLPERNRETLALTICNRDSIETDNKKEKIAFCFPIAIAEPKSFAFWIHQDEIGLNPKLSKPQSDVKNIFEAFNQMKDPTIIVSGADMKDGVLKMFAKYASTEVVPDNWFLFLDQFDSINVFLHRAGAGFVGGVPQRMRMDASSNGAIQCVITGEHIGLDRQFNGIACRRNQLEEPAVRKAIGQILWCWYRALQDIDRNLGVEANFIAANMNVHADERNPYQADDFIDVWRKKDYFAFPKTPTEMRKLIEPDRSYSHKFYDESNSLSSVVAEIESLLPSAS
jgi:hypothetical protein